MKPLILLSLLASEALAAGGGGGHHDGVPWAELVIPQIVNFTILASALFFALRNPVKNFFKSKAEDFSSAVNRAADAKKKAEAAYNEIKNRLTHLEKSAEDSRKQAQADAAALRSKMIDEAKAEAQKEEQDAQKSIQFEYDRMVSALKAELVSNSIKLAEEQVVKSTDAAETSDLQKAFSAKAAKAYAGARQ